RDNLANRYGEDAVFMDIDSIPLGFDYRKQEKDALAENKVMIAVIGLKWLGGAGKDARINENNDPVRIEQSPSRLGGRSAASGWSGPGHSPGSRPNRALSELRNTIVCPRRYLSLAYMASERCYGRRCA